MDIPKVSLRDAYRNLPEQIIFLLDTHTELTLPMNDSSYAGAGTTRLDAFKSLLKRWIHLKHTMGPHKFALGFVSDVPTYLLDFTANVEEFGGMLDNVLNSQMLRTCSKFNVGSVLHTVMEHVSDLVAPSNTPSAYITRLVLVLARSACELVPMTAGEAGQLKSLLLTGRLFVDVMYMHDSKPLPTVGNLLGTQQLYDALNEAYNPLDLGYSYGWLFEVVLDLVEVILTVAVSL